MPPKISRRPLRIQPRRRLVPFPAPRAHRHNTRNRHAALLPAGQVKGGIYPSARGQRRQTPPPRPHVQRLTPQTAAYCGDRRQYPPAGLLKQLIFRVLRPASPTRKRTLLICFGSCRMSCPSSRTRPASGRVGPFSSWWWIFRSRCVRSGPVMRPRRISSVTSSNALASKGVPAGSDR